MILVTLNAEDMMVDGIQSVCQLDLSLEEYPILAQVLSKMEDSVVLSGDMSGVKEYVPDIKIGGVDLKEVSPAYDYLLAEGRFCLYLPLIDMQELRKIIQGLETQTIELI